MAAKNIKMNGVWLNQVVHFCFKRMFFQTGGQLGGNLPTKTSIKYQEKHQERSCSEIEQTHGCLDIDSQGKGGRHAKNFAKII